MENAIILCSGGLDSVVTAYYAQKKLGYKKIILLFFNYGQRTLNEERIASKKCAERLRAEFHEAKLEELGNISGSLINNNKKPRKIKRKELKNTRRESEKYYVPFRNAVFLSHAIAFSDALKLKNKESYDIFVGFKCEGKEAYPDTTQEFVNAMNKLIKFSSNANGKIIAPLIKKDKEDIVLLGKKLGVNLEDTFSCYAGSKNGKHCGTCLSCRLRREGFYWANVKDDTSYVER